MIYISLPISPSLIMKSPGNTTSGTRRGSIERMKPSEESRRGEKRRE
jgi:hypothetical protein